MAISSDPRDTYAIAVGIEWYDDDSWFLPGAARDAVLWVNWLLSHHVPAKNIKLLIDAKDVGTTRKELSDKGMALHTATHVAFLDAIEELQGKSGNLLIYWSGHGAIDPDSGERRLFYPEKLRNLSVEQVQLALHSAAETIHRGQQTTGIEQLLIAPPFGELSANSHANGGGKFSQNLRAILETETWPPDFARIRAELQNPSTALPVAATPLDRRRMTLLRCDRKVPAQKFKDALKEYMTPASRWPLVHLIHGDERELHGRFVDRLTYDAAEELKAGDPYLANLEWNNRLPNLAGRAVWALSRNGFQKEPKEFRKLEGHATCSQFFQLQNVQGVQPTSPVVGIATASPGKL